MKSEMFTRIMLILIAVLLAWDVFTRDVRPVQAQGPFTVIRLSGPVNESSMKHWADELNRRAQEVVAVVPEQRTDGYIVILHPQHHTNRQLKAN